MSAGWVMDLSQWYLKLDQMEHVGDDALMALENVVGNAFEDTQARVHVVTGSLRGSGKVETEFTGDQWSAEIEYGGASPGFPRNPVNYAEIERTRGAEHDFFAGMDDFQGQILTAMQSGF